MSSEALRLFHIVIRQVLSNSRTIIEETGLDANAVDDLISDLKSSWEEKLLMATGDGVLKSLASKNDSLMLNPNDLPDSLDIPQLDGAGDDRRKRAAGSTLLQKSLARKETRDKEENKTETNIELNQVRIESEQEIINEDQSIALVPTSIDVLHITANTEMNVGKRKANEDASASVQRNKKVPRLRPAQPETSQVSNQNESCERAAFEEENKFTDGIFAWCCFSYEENFLNVDIDDEEYFFESKKQRINDDDDDDGDASNYVLAQYTKVWKPAAKNQKRGGREKKDIFKFSLENVVMLIEGIDYVVKGLEGELLVAE